MVKPMLIITAMLTTTCVVLRRVLRIRQTESYESQQPTSVAEGASLLEPKGKPSVRG